MGTDSSLVQSVVENNSCNFQKSRATLVRLHLAKFYDPETENQLGFWLRDVTHLDTRFLDNVIEAPVPWPFPEINDVVARTVSGWSGHHGFCGPSLDLKVTYGLQLPSI